MPNYYNNYSKQKNYKALRYQTGRGLQTTELNESQSIQHEQTKGIADAIFADGDIIHGGELLLDASQFTASISTAKVYIKGHVHDIDATTLTISFAGKVTLGVWLNEKEITELEDPSLLSPAKDTRGYQQKGASRLQVNCFWGLATEGDGDFYPIHEIIDGIQRQNTPPPQLDAVTTGLARYDYAANGSYITAGLTLTYLTNHDNKQHFSLSEGQAHVNGYEISLPHAAPLHYDTGAELESIKSESHLFAPDSTGIMHLTLNKSPLAVLANVDIEAQKTITLLHGSYSGVKDPLPDNSVLKITEVKQGNTSFKLGDDYKLTSGKVDWSMGGNEPSPSSSYEITYHYRTQAQASNIGINSFDLDGAVPDTLVLVDYDWAMPRHDVITLDQRGTIRKIKGIPHPYNPPQPAVPSGQLLLARIYQDWINNPVISNDGVRVIPMQGLVNMQRSIANLYDLMAIERLQNNASAQEQNSIKGIFVDPFLDDDKRDQGIPQDAAIVDGSLVLPVSADVQDSTIQQTTLLPYQLKPVLSQPERTGEMKINPYMAFAPLPAQITLTPSVDNWTETTTNWLSDETNRITRGGGWLTRVTTTTTEQLVSQQDSAATTLRPRRVDFELKGFGVNEGLEIVFDGITLEAKI